MIVALAQKLANYYHKFAVADATTRLTMLKRSAWYYGVWLPVRLVFCALALLALVLLKVLRPLVKVRVGTLPYDRIGNLAQTTELYLRRRSRSKTDREWHVFLIGEPANRQLLTMIKRQVPVWESRLMLWIQRIVRERSSNPDLWIELYLKGNEYHEFSKVAPQLAFTEEEEARGKEVLARMGIEPGTPFVCLHTRDKAYLDTIHNYRLREEWSYHDYRDSDIGNYLAAMEYLASFGLFAIRMGYTVENALPTNKHRIIDYATLYRSDFGDIYLPAKCKFFVGTSGGIASLAYIFDVPGVFANLIPLEMRPFGKHNLFIPKKLWSVERKRFLTFREILACGAGDWGRTHQYTQAAIEVVENTPDEILALVEEMNARLDGTWVTRDEDEQRQQRFRDVFPRGHQHHPSTRIGTEFLRQNRELLD
ncbi:TIGR04372 family glycosyltransferase [Acidobacteria bacterium AH-259-D05]|nr:TIGR04372 family glycosyltransferase [Acidobacteria bacterium AH-259-D05]